MPRYKTVEDYEEEAVWSKGPRSEEIGECLITPAKTVGGQYDVVRKITARRRGTEPPLGLDCCHVCDTPACIRESHIFLATHAENQRDAAAKGRMKWTQPNRWKVLAKRNMGNTYGRARAGLKHTEETHAKMSALKGLRQTTVKQFAFGYGA